MKTPAVASVESVSEGVLVTDRDGRIIYANRAYADLMGATNERAALGASAARIDMELEDTLSRITAPTLIVTTQESGLQSVAAVERLKTSAGESASLMAGAFCGEAERHPTPTLPRRGGGRSRSDAQTIPSPS